MKDETIRRQVGQLFGVLIGENQWDEVFEQLKRENRLNSLHIQKLLLIILKKIEELENVSK